MRHDFRSPFRHGVLSALHGVSDDWVGPAYQFADTEIEKVFSVLLAANGEFIELIGSRIYSADENPKWATPLTNLDRAGGLTESTRQGIRLLNKAARELMAKLSKFEEIARLRLNA